MMFILMNNKPLKQLHLLDHQPLELLLFLNQLHNQQIVKLLVQILVVSFLIMSLIIQLKIVLNLIMKIFLLNMR